VQWLAILSHCREESLLLLGNTYCGFFWNLWKKEQLLLWSPMSTCSILQLLLTIFLTLCACFPSSLCLIVPTYQLFLHIFRFVTSTDVTLVPEIDTRSGVLFKNRNQSRKKTKMCFSFSRIGEEVDNKPGKWKSMLCSFKTFWKSVKTGFWFDLNVRPCAYWAYSLKWWEIARMIMYIEFNFF
jgi:hypothetical protein